MQWKVKHNISNRQYFSSTMISLNIIISKTYSYIHWAALKAQNAYYFPNVIHKRPPPVDLCETKFSIFQAEILIFISPLFVAFNVWVCFNVFYVVLMMIHVAQLILLAFHYVCPKNKCSINNSFINASMLSIIKDVVTCTLYVMHRKNCVWCRQAE